MNRKLSKRARIDLAYKRVSKEIANLASGGRIAAGLSSEGYSGGYRDALADFGLVLSDVKPTRRDYWDDWE